MDIKRTGSQPSGKGPAEYFTGAVRVDPLFNAPSPARVFGASVTFEPGARTAWHTHPLGQLRNRAATVNQVTTVAAHLRALSRQASRHSGSEISFCLRLSARR